MIPTPDKYELWAPALLVEKRAFAQRYFPTIRQACEAFLAELEDAISERPVGAPGGAERGYQLTSTIDSSKRRAGGSVNVPRRDSTTGVAST